MNQEPTTSDILEAINDFSTKVDKELGTLKADVGTLKADVGTLKVDVGTLKADVGTLKADVTTIKATMVDKDYLDRALAKQKGEIVLLSRKGDIKLREMASILRDKQVLTQSEFDHIMSMEPFPQLSV